MAKKTDVQVRAAGGVVWRVVDGSVRIALVHRPRYDDWSLPKGKLERGEDELTAAVREVGEETGALVAVSRRLRTVCYRIADGDKTVDFWQLRHVSGEFEAGDEVDELAWLSPDEARARLTHVDETVVLEDFCATPLPDAIVVLVRHAKAGKRSEWHRADGLRPLDGSGRKQAKRLADFLDRFAPDRIVTARPVRCAQTVAPLAAQLGLEVTTDAAFDDHAFDADPDASEAALRALAAPSSIHRPIVTVVASQGNTIPGLVERIAPHVHSTATRKGAAWVLPFADGNLLAADYYPSAAR